MCHANVQFYLNKQVLQSTKSNTCEEECLNSLIGFRVHTNLPRIHFAGGSELGLIEPNAQDLEGIQE